MRSQETTGGGENDTSGLLPIEIRRIGAILPQSPLRNGASGIATASIPLSSCVQRALASSTSPAGHSVGIFGFLAAASAGFSAFGSLGLAPSAAFAAGSAGASFPAGVFLSAFLSALAAGLLLSPFSAALSAVSSC